MPIVTDTAAITVSRIHKRYGDVQAVDGATFEVHSGEVFGLLGPNGAGKTTTMEIIEGVRRADSGEVVVLGESPWPRNSSLLPRIGVQLQASSFFERLTAREQIRTFASLYGVNSADADRWLDMVGLTEQADQRTERLSGGEQQRLSLACALSHGPELVFLDEPTSGLDPQGRRNLWDVLRAVNEEGRTVVITTHYMEEAEALCDRVAIIDGGQILAAESPEALIRGLDAPTRITIAAGIVSGADAKEMADGDEVFDDGTTLSISTRQPATVLAALARRGALHGLSVQSATLEDVFLELTGREYRT